MVSHGEVSALSRALWHWFFPTVLLLGCAHQPPPSAAPPVAARERAIEAVDNLEAFARVYGYVRYFHPTDAAANADWHALAAQGCAYVEDARSLGELADRLEAFFEPLAPTIEIWVAGEPIPPSRAPVEGSPDDLVYWQYLGYPGAVFSLYSPPYSKVRVNAESRGRRFSKMPARDDVVQVQVHDGLYVRLPTILHRDEAKATGQHAAAEGLDPQLRLLAGSSKGGDNRNVQQAAVIEVWNVLRHFYPYQSEVPVDWKGALRRALGDVEKASVAEAIVALQHLVHALEDGHGEVGHVRHANRGALPFSLDVVEGQAVIVGTEDPAHFRVGDVVETIGDEPAIGRIAKIERLLSGSPQWRRFKAAAWEAPKGPKGTSVDVVLERHGERLTVTTEYGQREPILPPRPEPVHTYEDGIWYVDLTRAEWDDIEPVLPELAVAPGVVFDMRGYPTDTHPIIDHLIDAQEDALWMHVPAIVAPDGAVADWRHIGWHRKPAEPHIEGNVAFLTGPGAISYGESLMAYVEAHDLGTRVGQPTAGANGDIVRVEAAGGYFIIFSGMRVTKHDGTNLHRVGLSPELVVEPTLSGLRSGRDETLELGLDVARGRVDPSSPQPRIAAP